MKLIDYSKHFAKERPILFSVLFCFLFSFITFFTVGMFDQMHLFPENSRISIFSNRFIMLCLAIILIQLFHSLREIKITLSLKKGAFGVIIVSFIPLAILTLGRFPGNMFGNWWILSIAFIDVIFIGVIEEFTFRGMIFRLICDKHGVVLGVFLSSVVFGLMHLLNWFNHQNLNAAFYNTIWATGAGVFLVALLIRTGSILIPVIWHALMAFQSIISQYIDPSKYFEKLATNTESAGVASALILFSLFSAIGIFLIRKEISQSFASHLKKKILVQDQGGSEI
jgi:membrane protease YdiL (CAAX protease family)